MFSGVIPGTVLLLVGASMKVESRSSIYTALLLPLERRATFARWVLQGESAIFHQAFCKFKADLNMLLTPLTLKAFNHARRSGN